MSRRLSRRLGRRWSITLLAMTAAVPASAGPGAVSSGGVTLKSTSVTLPSDERQFSGGPAASAINANCLTCHSAGMVLNQPHLAKADWEAEVGKMRKVYGAPVDPSDVPAIVAYLAALPPR